MRRTRPLEDVSKVLAGWDRDFDAAWESNKVPNWDNAAARAAAPSRSSDPLYCGVCEKGFANQAVYNNHLTGKKHVRAAKAREEQSDAQQQPSAAGQPAAAVDTGKRAKERAVAEREWRVTSLAAAMSTERSDTRVNVERRQVMTQRERQQELETYLAMTSTGPRTNAEAAQDDEDDDGEEKIHNPLKLPLAWDGKPIPFWLYRLHGLGVEFACEICGNFVYMGRRAFDKHFNEARHIYGLKCLGITSTGLFRDITKIQAAMDLWDKIQKDKKSKKVDESSVVQMEDGEGNVMPEKVYYDLQKQGLL